MNIILSNYEFRSYTKKIGDIWLHMRTHLLIEISVSFSMNAYLRNITGSLALPNSSDIEIDGIAVTLETAAKYDGRFLVHELTLCVPTGRKILSPCVARLVINCELNFHGADFLERHEHPAFVRRAIRYQT